MTEIPKYLLVNTEDLQLQELVGQGGYGEVHKATWTGRGGGITVAVKKIIVSAAMSANKPKFNDEVQMLANLRHPHILQVYGACLKRNELWIVTEFIQGNTLFDLLHSPISLDWNTRMSLAHQAAIAINALHESTTGILHRDIKSLNFLVSKDLSTLKLIDFGVSKWSDVISSVPRESIGTVRWGAPETLVVPPRWSFASDIFALGMTFYEIAARKYPFEDEEIQDTDRLIHFIKIGHRPNLPEDCPEEFSKIICACWDRSAENRPTSRLLVNALQIERQKEENKYLQETKTRFKKIRLLEQIVGFYQEREQEQFQRIALLHSNDKLYQTKELLLQTLLNDYLLDIKRLLLKQVAEAQENPQYTKNLKQLLKNYFIFYIQETDPNENRLLQERLLQLQNDLTVLGTKVKLEYNIMSRNDNRNNLTVRLSKSHIILLICTKELMKRANESYGDYKLLIQTFVEKTYTKTVVPLIFSENVPFIFKNRCRNPVLFADKEKYYNSMVDLIRILLDSEEEEYKLTHDMFLSNLEVSTHFQEDLSTDIDMLL